MQDMAKLLTHLTSGWQGEALNGGGMIRVLNRSGRKPPLIWCFNSAHEFPTMAQGLGSDQPLIGLRSLHMVTPIGPNRFSEDEQTADLYMDLLLSSGLDLTGCAIGGNCQGGGIAAPLATRLLHSGVNVRTLIIMETQLPSPFPEHVGFVYGDRSEMFNPYLRGEDIEPKWNRLCRRWNAEIIPGAHGEYFTAENTRTTCAAIERLIQKGHQSNELPVDRCVEMRTATDLPGCVPAGVPLQIEFAPNPDCSSTSEDDPLALHYYWVSKSSGLLEAPEALVFPTRNSNESAITLALCSPEVAGEWNLRMFLCRLNSGPVAWRYFDQKRFAISVQ